MSLLVSHSRMHNSTHFAKDIKKVNVPPQSCLQTDVYSLERAYHAREHACLARAHAYLARAHAYLARAHACLARAHTHASSLYFTQTLVLCTHPVSRHFSTTSAQTPASWSPRRVSLTTRFRPNSTRTCRGHLFPPQARHWFPSDGSPIGAQSTGRQSARTSSRASCSRCRGTLHQASRTARGNIAEDDGAEVWWQAWLGWHDWRLKYIYFAFNVELL